jgi:uncharacterized protein YndB with AHSA1/START domain
LIFQQNLYGFVKEKRFDAVFDHVSRTIHVLIRLNKVIPYETVNQISKSKSGTMKAFQTSREIPVQPELIFAVISNPERLAKWWGPAGFSNTFNQFQFKPGGKWSFVMHGPDGANYPNESEFIEIIPNQKVVIRHHSQPNFTLTITLTGLTNSSMIHWNQEFDDEVVAKNIAHIVEPANEQNLDRLSAEVSDN